MNNKVKIIKAISGIAVLIILFFAFTKMTENKSLNAFAKNYSDFRNEQYDTFIYSYVPIIDISVDENGETTGDKNYFTYLAGAVDTKQTNAFRKSNAKQALSSYSSIQQKTMGSFSDHIGKLDLATSKLIETANKINSDEYRTTAIEVTKYARQIQQDYESLRLKYVERFNLQTKLLNELVKNDGDIFSLGITLEEGGTKIPKINKNIENLTVEIDGISQKMNDAYSSLKGRTEFKDYPNKFTENK